MGKSSLEKIARDHFVTLYDYSKTGSNEEPSSSWCTRVDWEAVTLQIVAPAIAVVLICMFNVKWRDVDIVVSGVSIISGLLFAMAIYLFQLRVTLPNDARLSEKDYRLLDECMHNTLWAILCGLFLTVYLVICGTWGLTSLPVLGSIFTGVAIAIAIHFLSVIAMCLKRLRRAYERIAMKES